MTIVCFEIVRVKLGMCKIHTGRHAGTHLNTHTHTQEVSGVDASLE